MSFLLPGFSFENIRGVLKNDKVGIKLGSNDEITKALFNNFKNDLEKFFHLQIDIMIWERARDTFMKTFDTNPLKINMAYSQSYCIGDLENDGCRIIKKDSNSEKLAIQVDFSKTQSKLCSVVVFMHSADFSQHFYNNRNLCFEAYADAEINNISIEILLNNENVKTDIYVDEDEKTYKIPLTIMVS